jgi:dTDP-4-dehydrorhamnose 3,5-epimerase
MGRTVRRCDSEAGSVLKVRKTELPGVYTLEPEVHADSRGLFTRLFDADVLREVGAETQYAQHSTAYNRLAGTLRGLHYQIDAAEAKIVRCTRGALYDVAVDLRRESPTFGKWFGIDLSEESRRSLYVPPGCAHGYQTTRDGTEVAYLISVPYKAGDARGVHYADPNLAIQWPMSVTSISERDQALPPFDRADLP